MAQPIPQQKIPEVKRANTAAKSFLGGSIIFNAMDLHFASRQPIFLRMATALPVRESIGDVLEALEIVARAQN